MEKNKEAIINLYITYGFEYRKDLSDYEKIVFTISHGLFDNAIIVEISNNKESDSLEQELTDLGFNVKREHFESIEKTQNSLFNGFFSLKKTKALFDKDYDEHIKNIANSFPISEIEYNYIHSPYYKDSDYYESGSNILEDIHSEMKSHGPKLILIEAPAGFGKTCTAYEIGKLVSKNDNDRLILFAELSRDRHAKIFNHVLHKEVARSFPTVSPDLVLREIKNGKVVVILDGFDELLNEREDERFQFEKSQAMLETIGKILEINAKVILTTRKTAILQGDDFDEWIGSNSSNFDFTRYTLKEPSAQNWLGYQRSQLLNESRVNIKNLSNPVLLTFLRFIDNEEFNNMLINPDSIVENYFKLILRREMERQTLRLSVEEQSEFLKRLAQSMIKHNYIKTTKDKILDYLSESEIELIETSRSRYSSDARPTFEEMLDKLSNHALLDRSSTDEKIGFVNDFVLGHFVGMDLLSTDGEWLADSIFVEAAVNSFSSRTQASRLDVWDRLQESLKYLNDDERVTLELALLDRVTGVYRNSQFKDINFDTENLFATGSVEYCYFNECIFKNCTIDFSIFKSNTFISCCFYNCKTININLNNDFILPIMDEISREELSSCLDTSSITEKKPSEEDKIKAYILEKFWPIGKETIAFAHRPLFIFYRGSTYPTNEISITIDNLRKSGLIVSAKRKNWVGLDISGHNIQTIKEILGR
ncbi:NACHT domain-containing protein [Dickeya undicola]|uniref:AAA family ATPase n=1 Tax=Dickeya undicola TaxID=1577887 RepID=A0A3N0FXB9_9GAMM|nr:ATP-binding protein [Dickeya undicola]RNM04651.1 AAA family ATPase [Dickeya undicola]